MACGGQSAGLLEIITEYRKYNYLGIENIEELNPNQNPKSKCQLKILKTGDP